MSASRKPESALSKSSAQPSVGSSSKEKMKSTDFKVYKPPSRASVPLPNLPDSFFTPTTADLRAAQAQLAARTQALIHAPLHPRAQREAEAKAKLDRWPETRIRIKFTDGTLLEKVFPSTNKIRSVYAFVRDSLREDVKPIKFILSQPPKRDLKVSDLTVRDLTLAQLQLAPSSILLLRFEDESLNHDTIPAPLDPCILAQAVDLPTPLPIKDEAEDSSQKTPSATAQATASSSKGGGAKVPKWMKIGQKK
jgi:tether containing UBX domain for GLUT4